MELSQYAAAFKICGGQLRQRFHACADSFPNQSADTDHAKFIAVPGHEVSFQSEWCSCKQYRFHFLSSFQFIGDGDGRENVPARAAIGNQYIHTHTFCETFSKTPTPIMLTSREEPPELINGRGIPLVGINPMTTLMLMNAWSTIRIVIPAARNCPNGSGAFHAIRNPRHRKNMNARTTPIQPINPSSSPTIA